MKYILFNEKKINIMLCCLFKNSKKVIPRKDIFYGIDRYNGKIWGLNNYRYI